ILVERLRPIFKKAIELGVFVNLDMENYALKNLTLEVFEQMILDPEFSGYPHWGIVLQAYLRDSLADAEKLVALAKKRKVPFTIRLVKGAYWDFETIFSEQRGWPYPVYTNKKESDVNFEAITEVLLENHQFLQLALGSHNARSLAAALVLVEKLKINPKALEVQMLYGMADQFKKALVKMGVRVREYAPVGDLIPGMAYLVRRLLENTSNESFLRSKFAENVSVEKLTLFFQYIFGHFFCRINKFCFVFIVLSYTA
ncbi:MAG: proline dehydrogenase family protein, partial [Bdellovibrionales bacterium]